VGERERLERKKENEMKNKDRKGNEKGKLKRKRLTCSRSGQWGCGGRCGLFLLLRFICKLSKETFHSRIISVSRTSCQEPLDLEREERKRGREEERKRGREEERKRGREEERKREREKREERGRKREESGKEKGKKRKEVEYER
jgi:hypothetical protein